VYFTSFEYWNQITTPVGATGHLGPHDSALPRKLTWQASDATRLMLLGEYEGLVNERRGIDAYTLPEASSKQDAPGVIFGLSMESLVNSDNFFTIKATGYDGRDDYLPYNGPDVPARNDYYDTELWWNNAELTQLGYRRCSPSTARGACSRTGGSSRRLALLQVRRAVRGWEVLRRLLPQRRFSYYDDSTMCDSSEAYFADPSCAVSTDASIYIGFDEYNQHPSSPGWRSSRRTRCGSTA